MSVVSSAKPKPAPRPEAPELWSGITRFLARRRVPISTFLFASLAVADVLSGVRPHDLLNLRDPFVLTGYALVILGTALRSWAVGILRKNDVLTTTGPYGWARNPLYAGSFMMLFGFCALIGEARFVWFMLVPIAILYIFRIQSEERDLAYHFGGAWTEYQRHTPRIIPRRIGSFSVKDWRLSKWLASREYRAVLGALAGLVAIQSWREIVIRWSS